MTPVHALVGVLLAVSPAAAFCLTNGAAVPVHVMALDTSGFEADLAPGQRLCRDARADIQLMAVTGYVPLQGDQRPGWRAECRIRLAADGEADIAGSRDDLTCAAR